MIPGGLNPMLLSAGGGAPGYQIQRSLRFRRSASAYMGRTFVTGDRTTWVLSIWVKRGLLGAQQFIFGYDNSNIVCFDDNDRLFFECYNGPGADYYLRSNAQFRDPTAWLHLVLVWDTNNATSTDRQRMYVNGQRITSFLNTGNTVPSGAMSTINNALPHLIGSTLGGGIYLDGYLAEPLFVGGQALTPSAFGQLDSRGNWQPKEYAGTYGTNGFRLKFDDTTSLTTLTADSSGNGNNWTANNISLTAGATYDSMLDVPLGVGGGERGNYCGIVSIAANPAFSIEANLKVVGVSAATASLYSRGSFSIDSGKWYWEVTATEVGGGPNMRIGIQSAAYTSTSGNFNEANGAYVYQAEGQKQNEGTATAYGTSYTNGDVIGIALDKDAGTLSFYKNGISQGTAFSSLPTSVVPVLMLNVGGTSRTITGNFNFGQRPFSYTPPAGFKALHTGNLPDPAIQKPTDHFQVKLDTGANIKTSAEAIFPSNFLEWIKDRANANNHQLIDIVRGTSGVLQSNTSAAETTYVTPSGSSAAFVWKAGGTPVSNTDGTIASQVSANVAAGQSIVAYTGTAVNGTIGHGLVKTPKFIIEQRRNGGVVDWQVYHEYLGKDKALQLNQTATPSTISNYWFNGVDSSVFGVNGSWPAINGSGTNHIAYCFAEVPGYSKFGSVAMNGSADGAYFDTGFDTALMMMKRIDSASNWIMIDSTRQAYNVMGPELYANLSNIESVVSELDFTARGIKFRNASLAGTWIIAAWARVPFKYAPAR